MRHNMRVLVHLVLFGMDRATEETLELLSIASFSLGKVVLLNHSLPGAM